MSKLGLIKKIKTTGLVSCDCYKIPDTNNLGEEIFVMFKGFRDLVYHYLFGPKVRLHLVRRVHWSRAIHLMVSRKQRQTNRTPNMVSFPFIVSGDLLLLARPYLLNIIPSPKIEPLSKGELFNT